MFETAKGDYPFWCFGMKAVSVTDVLFFSDGWKKTQKIKRKKAKGAWQSELFCDTFFFACDAPKRCVRVNWSLKLKGRERRKSQRAKIFGKENKRRTKNKGWEDAKRYKSCFV